MKPIAGEALGEGWLQKASIQERKETALLGAPDDATRSLDGLGHRGVGVGEGLPFTGGAIEVFLGEPALKVEGGKRRRFSASYKLKVLAEVDACSLPGQISALLRREGLYSSHLTNWRHQRDSGALSALRPTKPGPKAKQKDPHGAKNKELEKETRHRVSSLWILAHVFGGGPARISTVGTWRKTATVLDQTGIDLHSTSNRGGVIGLRPSSVLSIHGSCHPFCHFLFENS